MAMDAFIRTIVDDNGDILPGAEVTVKVGSSGGANATLYQDEDGNTSQSNPVTADADGLVKFYAASGVYWIQASFNGETVTWERVRLFSMDEPGDIGASTPIPNLYVTTLHYNGVEITASPAEINFLDGVTSAIQTQLDAKYESGDSPSFADGSFTGTMEIGGNTIIGSTSVTPDGTLHVHTGSAGTVTADASAAVGIFESGTAGGISVLVPDNQFGRIVIGSPSDNQGMSALWRYSSLTGIFGTDATGATLELRAGAGVPNLTLSGASGSERASFVKDVVYGGYLQRSGGNALYNDTSSTSGIIAQFRSNISATDTQHCVIRGDGDLENTNNSYGALSDIKIKVEDSIEPSGSQIGDTMKLARIMSKFNLKADPDGFKQLGWIAQKVREISPGLVKESPDMEIVEVEKTRQVERQKTQTVEKPVAKQEIEIVEGRAVLRQWHEVEPVEEPVFDEYPLEDTEGNPLMVKVKATAALYDREGNVIQEAQEERIEQAVHRVPVMETVEETYTEKEERQIILPDGTPSVTLSLKHSVAHLKAFKALGELFDMIKDADGMDDLKAKIAAALSA